MSAPVLVCFAVPQEAKPFRKHVTGRYDVRVLVTGMGRHNAEKSLQRELAKASPSVVLTCGFAGALDPALRVGNVVFETTDEVVRKKLEAAGARPVRFCCAETVAITVSDKRRLAKETGAAAVEMESGCIQSLCRNAGVPCATVRAISDEAGEDLPLDFNLLMTRSHRLSPIKLALAVLLGPHRIPALMRLGRNSARAAEMLSTVLMKVV